MEDVVDEAYASPGDYIELDKFRTVNYIVVITREWVANDNPISTTWSLIYQVLSRPERIVQGEGMYLQNYLDVNDELIPETDSVRYLACKAWGIFIADYFWRHKKPKWRYETLLSQVCRYVQW